MEKIDFLPSITECDYVEIGEEAQLSEVNPKVWKNFGVHFMSFSINYDYVLGLIISS